MIIKSDNRRVAGSFFVRRHPKFDVSDVPGIPVVTHLKVLPDSSRIKYLPQPLKITGDTAIVLLHSAQCAMQKRLLVQSESNVNGASYSTANHRVVTHTEEAHHLNVSRNRRRTCELSVRVHTAESICHTV